MSRPAPVDPRRLRILHVFRAPLGGLFRHVLDVTAGQVERGHAVGIFCDASTGGERADQVLADLAPRLALGVHRVPMRRNPGPRDLSSLSALNRLYRRIRPDVLHGHGSKGGAYARLATVRALDPHVIRAYTPHGGSFNYKPGTWLHRAYMGVEGLLARRTDVFLFESEYVAGRFRSFVGETDRLTRIVHNGISAAEFEPLPRQPDPFDLVYVGELRTAKGIETLLQAVALLRRDRGTRLTLLVVGSGPSEHDLKVMAREIGIWDSVAFVPPQPIREALARGRVMVIPSRAESLPYVILEAAAAAQPLVSTDVGGIPEIFGPQAGALIAPGRADVLAQSIRAALGVRLKALLEAALLRARIGKLFSTDAMVDGVLAGYGQALAGRSPQLHGFELSLS